MDGSFIILQSERSQFQACGPEIRVKNASNPQIFRDLDERFGRQFAGPVTPSVGEQNAADIQEQCRN
jgi:hypothetical protein